MLKNIFIGIRFSTGVTTAIISLLVMPQSCNRTQVGNKNTEKILQSIKSESLCEAEKKYPGPELIAKYGKHAAYNTTHGTTGEYRTVTFSFISDCCSRFSGTASQINDTLILRYFRLGATACDCFCDYSITYTLKKDIKPWKYLKTIYAQSRVK